MSNLKSLFNRDKEIAKQWGAVCHTDWFGKVMIYAVGIVTEGDVTTEQLLGAKKLKEALLTMAEDDSETFSEPASGLHHDVLAAAKELRAHDNPKKE